MTPEQHEVYAQFLIYGGALLSTLTLAFFVALLWVRKKDKISFGYTGPKKQGDKA